jgi:copper chaperone CopZ
MKNLIFMLLFTINGIIAVAQDNNTIKTNATCQLGQERIIKELKQMDGVFDVKFDVQGTITLDYSSDGTPYNDIVQKITECGFTANGIAPKGGDKNLCKTTTIQKTSTKSKSTK